MSEFPARIAIEKPKQSRKVGRLIGGVALAAALTIPVPGTDTSLLKGIAVSGEQIDEGFQELVQESTGVVGDIIPGFDSIEQIHNSNDTKQNIDTYSTRYFQELNK